MLCIDRLENVVVVVLRNCTDVDINSLSFQACMESTPAPVQLRQRTLPSHASDVDPIMTTVRSQPVTMTVSL